MIILSGIFLLIIGGIAGYQVASMPKFIVMQQNKAIQNYFGVKSNEYTYYFENAEGVEDSFILSLENTEYRIKFSKNKPIKVVFAEELAPITG
ncbi:hypothetical protein SHT67_14325 (plasmid) [Enterococcus faecalis]|uniref:hypothetical protein n=1 Tax=Enterococcus faecalis TaxID=1351 RepID=UPI0029C76FFA|nr:hypothetical protein [Enterococcus faecalis]WPH48351.1 hypothetical protein SHT67_14325 [Enterococcus faecalis]